MTIQSGIYTISHAANGHKYIGSSVNIQGRWARHRGKLRAGKHHSRYLQRAWDKYGEDCFRFDVIEECAPSFLIEREQHWMDISKPEYNLAPIAGSSLGRVHMPETRAKISAANMGKKRNLGRKATPETRAKMSASRIGKHPSAETRARLSACKRGRRFSDEARAKMSASRTGKRLSAETRARMSVANTGSNNPSYGNPDVGRWANHIRWHANRAIVNTTCKFCGLTTPR